MITQDEIDKNIDIYLTLLNEVSNIRSQSAQIFALHTRMSKFITDIWKSGYSVGLKESEKQKTSVIIKKLTKEN